jgi:hypothetical protein
MLDSDTIARIRTIFLQVVGFVSVPEAAALLGRSLVQINSAIKSGEIAAVRGCSGKVIERDELVAQALQLWPVETIEQALGAKAAGILPESVRTRPFHARLPRYQLAMLEYIAQTQHTTVNSLLALAVDDFAADHAGELSSIIPGLADALEWVNNADQQHGQPS